MKNFHIFYWRNKGPKWAEKVKQFWRQRQQCVSLLFFTSYTAEHKVAKQPPWEDILVKCYQTQNQNGALSNLEKENGSFKHSGPTWFQTKQWSQVLQTLVLIPDPSHNGQKKNPETWMIKLVLKCELKFNHAHSLHPIKSALICPQDEPRRCHLKIMDIKMQQHRRAMDELNHGKHESSKSNATRWQHHLKIEQFQWACHLHPLQSTTIIPTLVAHVFKNLMVAGDNILCSHGP